MTYNITLNRAVSPSAWNANHVLDSLTPEASLMEKTYVLQLYCTYIEQAILHREDNAKEAFLEKKIQLITLFDNSGIADRFSQLEKMCEVHDNVKKRHSVGDLPKIFQGITRLAFPDGKEIQISLKEEKSPRVIEVRSQDHEGLLLWSFYPETGALYLNGAHLGGFPPWIQMAGMEEFWFDKERGFPTMQVMKAMACNALGCHGKVKSIVLITDNCQTTVDIVYDILVKQLPLFVACKNCKSALLAKEAGMMAGVTVQLAGIRCLSHDHITVTAEHLMERIQYANSSPPSYLTLDRYVDQAKIQAIQEVMGNIKKRIQIGFELTFESI